MGNDYLSRERFLWASNRIQDEHTSSLNATARLATGLLTLAVLSGCASLSKSAAFDWSRQDVVVVADTTVGQRPVTNTVLRYPMKERVHGNEAGFVAAFVLDTLGRVELGSVSFIGNAPSAFVESACEYFRNVRYAPPRVEGTGTPALIVMPLVFALEGGQWYNKTLDVSSVRERLRREGAVAALAELQGLPHCPQR